MVSTKKDVYKRQGAYSGGTGIDDDGQRRLADIQAGAQSLHAVRIELGHLVSPIEGFKFTHTPFVD